MEGVASVRVCLQGWTQTASTDKVAACQKYKSLEFKLTRVSWVWSTMILQLLTSNIDYYSLSSLGVIETDSIVKCEEKFLNMHSCTCYAVVWLEIAIQSSDIPNTNLYCWLLDFSDTRSCASSENVGLLRLVRSTSATLSSFHMWLHDDFCDLVTNLSWHCNDNVSLVHFDFFVSFSFRASNRETKGCVLWTTSQT